MPLKLVTFDLAEPNNSSQLPEILKNLGETTRLSSTAFVVDSPLTTNQVLAKLMKAVDLEDDVYVLALAPFWSGYGETDVNAFLEKHLQRSDLPAL